MSIKLYISNESHTKYAVEICETIADASRKRGTGIAKRDPEYIKSKLKESKSIIALNGKELAGFCYIESWEHGKYVATSGLIVKEEYRGSNLAYNIKKKIVDYALERFPEAKMFGITTSLPVMKINSKLGYKPVTFSELTTDEEFWKGCKGCKNYDILQRNDRRMCLCTGMILDNTKSTSWTQKIKHFNRVRDFFKRNK
jgi:hypothetical protein